VFRTKEHPEQAYRACSGIQDLWKLYGAARLDAACQRAMTFDQYGYSVLLGILKGNLDSMPPVTSIEPALHADHENLRGATYYS